MKKLHCLIMILVTVSFGTDFAQAMTRTLKKEPAIVIVAFGTTTKAQKTYEFFEEQLRKELPPEYGKLKIEWAFTSEIVRERANKKFKESGSQKRYYSLMQVFANLEDEGYRKFAVQSLHIFPGQEFSEMEKIIETFSRAGLRIVYGGTLFNKWEEVYEVVGMIEKEFLSDGCNILVAHGSPETSHNANSIYLGLERYIVSKYPNVFVGAVEGVLTREQAIGQAMACPQKRVRFIPIMYVAGEHIMNDIMGKEPDQDGTVSWAVEMESAGFQVDTIQTTFQGEQFYKGLGFYPEINRKFIDKLKQSLKQLDYANPTSH